MPCPIVPPRFPPSPPPDIRRRILPEIVTENRRRPPRRRSLRKPVVSALSSSRSGCGDLPLQGKALVEKALHADGGRVHLPEDDIAALSVAPEDVGHSVSIEVGDPGHLPHQRNAGRDDELLQRAGPVHLPEDD